MITIWDGLDFGSVDNLDYRRRRSFSSTGPSSWSLDASETGGRTKCPWVGVVGLIPLGERAEKIGRLWLCFHDNHWALSIRPKIPEIPGLGANGTVIFRNFNPKFWVYLARLA